MNICVYGGQFGSEGKGNYVEWWINQHLDKIRIIWAEPSPNSGHTCTLGKLRQLPTGSFWAKKVYLGPDSLINLELLEEDLRTVLPYNPQIKINIHKHAGLVTQEHIITEQESTLVGRIASTASGVGHARSDKFIKRHEYAVAGTVIFGWPDQVRIIETAEWINDSRVCLDYSSANNIFECNQGVMLDPNFGYFPFCTSRSTLPDVALARNGLSRYQWTKHMIIRTFPIRTGGNSGPTGGSELTWEELQLPPEIATVTKRTRRVFEFSKQDFMTAMNLTSPDALAITHCDYVCRAHNSGDPVNTIASWLSNKIGDEIEGLPPTIFSLEPSKFKDLI